MPFLLRVELPDVPGSLGRLASAIGEAGGDIEAIEIVEKRTTAPPSTTCSSRSRPARCPTRSCPPATRLDGVRVVWISRYAAGGNLFLDLEAVEELTADPEGALDRLIDLLPVTFRADWAARVSKVDGDRLHDRGRAVRARPGCRSTGPSSIDVTTTRTPSPARARLNKTEIVVIGRRGGPEFLDSEIARLGHLVGLAMSISRAPPRPPAH